MKCIKVKPLDIEFPELLPFDLMTEYTKNLASSLNNHRENQILDVLKKEGYEFKDRKELEEFARTRCELITFTYNNKHILKVDGIALCEWDDTLDIKYEVNKIITMTL